MNNSQPELGYLQVPPSVRMSREMWVHCVHHVEAMGRLVYVNMNDTHSGHVKGVPDYEDSLSDIPDSFELGGRPVYFGANCTRFYYQP